MMTCDVTCDVTCDTYEWKRSAGATCHTYECVVMTYEYVMMSCVLDELCYTHYWVMQPRDVPGSPAKTAVQVSHGTCMNETGCMSCVCMRHVTHVNVPCHTCECAMLHIWICHVTYVDASCHICECVMSHMWMRHVTHVNASCHTCECVMSHMWMRHVTHCAWAAWSRALCCNTLQHTATHCNTLQRTATHCNTLQHTAPHHRVKHCTTHCKILQHAATHCNKHTTTHCNTL